MRGRVVAVITAVVVLVVLSPALRSSATRRLPAVELPDVRHRRGAHGRGRHGSRAAGRRQHRHAVAASSSPAPTRSSSPPARSPTPWPAARTARSRLCAEIAGRLGGSRPDVVQVRIATETLDAVGWFDGDTDPTIGRGAGHVPGAGTLKPPVARGAARRRRGCDLPAPPERLAMVRILVATYAVVWMAGALGGLARAGRRRRRPLAAGRAARSARLARRAAGLVVAAHRR